MNLLGHYSMTDFRLYVKFVFKILDCKKKTVYLKYSLLFLFCKLKLNGIIFKKCG